MIYIHRASMLPTKNSKREASPVHASLTRLSAFRFRLSTPRCGRSPTEPPRRPKVSLHQATSLASLLPKGKRRANRSNHFVHSNLHRFTDQNFPLKNQKREARNHQIAVTRLSAFRFPLSAFLRRAVGLRLR